MMLPSTVGVVTAGVDADETTVTTEPLIVVRVGAVEPVTETEDPDPETETATDPGEVVPAGVMTEVVVPVAAGVVGEVVAGAAEEEAAGT
jgi:hypothetical protein